MFIRLTHASEFNVSYESNLHENDCPVVGLVECTAGVVIIVVAAVGCVG